MAGEIKTRFIPFCDDEEIYRKRPQEYTVNQYIEVKCHSDDILVDLTDTKLVMTFDRTLYTDISNIDSWIEDMTIKIGGKDISRVQFIEMQNYTLCDGRVSFYLRDVSEFFQAGTIPATMFNNMKLYISTSMVAPEMTISIQI